MHRPKAFEQLLQLICGNLSDELLNSSCISLEDIIFFLWGANLQTFPR